MDFKNGVINIQARIVMARVQFTYAQKYEYIQVAHSKESYFEYKTVYEKVF